MPIWTPFIATSYSACPCDKSERVNVILADGEIFETDRGIPAGSLNWTPQGNPRNTIIAWAPVNQVWVDDAGH